MGYKGFSNKYWVNNPGPNKPCWLYALYGQKLVDKFTGETFEFIETLTNTNRKRVA